MKTFILSINKMAIIISLAITFIFSFSEVKAQYTINNLYGNLVDCDTMTRGIYIVWWDNSFNFSTEADELLDSMISYRSTCLNELLMVDPPNPLDGYYYNIYIHVPSDVNDIFNPFGWSNGQGTDGNGYPYLTLPNGVLNDWVNNAHETFHIFQYNATSPGFAYSGDSQWYIEASANWFAAKMNPTDNRAFIESHALVKVPQVPLWLSYSNYPSTYPSNWQRYVHQYGLAIYLYYLTEVAGIADNLITDGLFSATSELPQEYFYNQIGASLSRDYFIDYAAHMTNDFDFILPAQVAASEIEFNIYADLADDNQFTESYVNTGSGGWYQPNNENITNAWSFNTYKLSNSITESYTFEINGDLTGTYGDDSYFQGKVVVKNSSGATSFYDLIMTNNQQGSLTLNLTPDDYEVYFIIASMPNIFEDVNPSFQQFPYDMRISVGVISGIDNLQDSTEKVEVARYNYLGQKVEENMGGLQIILYNDGTTKRQFKFKY